MIYKSLQLIVFYLIVATPLTSQTITWTGNGDGINWADKDNWSTGFLPGNTDQVLIENDSVVLGLNTVEVIRIELKNTALTINQPLFITSDTFGILSKNSSLYLMSEILIDEAEIGLHLTDHSKFINQGYFKILSTSRQGVLTDTASILHNLAKMEILDAKFIGIESNGLLVNEDTIIISGGCRFYGLQTRDSVYNSPSGFIRAQNFPEGAPHGVRLENEEARFTNDGEIWIENLDFIGLQTRGVFRNDNLIYISSTKNHGIETQDAFINGEYGKIILDSAGLIAGAAGFNQFGGCFANHGLIELTNSFIGFDFSGYFENFDTIALSNIGSMGFQVFDTLHIHSDAVIQGFNIGSAPAWCFKNRSHSSLIRIEGKVRIDDCSMGLENNGHFELTSTGSFELSGISGEYLDNPEEAVFICDGLFILVD